MKHPARSYAPPAAAAADSIEDGLAVCHPVRSQRYDDDPDNKRRGRRRRRRPGSAAGAGGRMLLLLLATVVVFGALLLWSWSRAGLGSEEEPTLVGRAKAAATEAFAGANVKTLVQQGMERAGPKSRAEAKEEGEEEDKPEQGREMARGMLTCVSNAWPVR